MSAPPGDGRYSFCRAAKAGSRTRSCSRWSTVGSTWCWEVPGEGPRTTWITAVPSGPTVTVRCQPPIPPLTEYVILPTVCPAGWGTEPQPTPRAIRTSSIVAGSTLDITYRTLASAPGYRVVRAQPAPVRPSARTTRAETVEGQDYRGKPEISLQG